MAETVQRVPRGLGQVLSTFGGVTPGKIEDSIRGSLDLLQFYGLTQLQSAFANNAAAAEGIAVPVVLSASSWTILFGCTGNIGKTGTMTALRANLTMNRGTAFDALLFAEELGPFGATETGNAAFGGRLPFPVLLPPGATVACAASIIGTDATASVSVFAEFGTLG
jgi:hypothetical protein